MDEREKSYQERAGAHFAENSRETWPDEGFGSPVVSLPDFWKPEEVDEVRKGEVVAVRDTKDFGDRQGKAINLQGAEGMISIPVSAGLEGVDWRKQIGKVFKFTFKGWVDLKDGKRVRTFVVQPFVGVPAKRQDDEDVPF